MLIAFEGIDGSGKSTLIKSVAKLLRRRKWPVVDTAEPTTTALGRLVRKGLRERYDPFLQAGLFLADRAVHLATLTPALARGDVVLTDRYVDSTTAYQATALAGRVKGSLETLDAIQSALFPQADLVVWLDLPPRDALKRIRGRTVKEPYEKLQFLQSVRANYAQLEKAHPRRWLRLDARLPKAELARIVADAIDALARPKEKKGRRGTHRRPG